MNNIERKRGGLTLRLGGGARDGKRSLLRRRLDLEANPSPTAEGAIAAPLPTWPEPGEHVQILLDMRRSRKRRLLLRLALFCGLPTLLAALYMTLIASPRYVSEFQITYQTYQPAQKLSTGLVQSLLGNNQNSTVDLGIILDQYIQSPTLLNKLDKELGLKNYWSSSKVDYLSRMNPKASLATFLIYYHWYVSSSYSLGGYLTVDVQGFDPQFALKLSQAIIKACDEMMDNLTTRARQDEVKFAEGELKREEDRVRKARLALAEFQNAHGDINPPRSASQLSGIVGSLQSQLATAQTQLSDALAYMSPASPQVAAFKYKITAIESQIKRQQQLLADDSGTSYSKILEQYASLQLDEEFAKSAYQAAQQGVEVARADAARQQSYLTDFATPYLPDQASWAIPVLYTLTVFVASLVLFGIGSLIGAAFSDHADI